MRRADAAGPRELHARLLPSSWYVPALPAVVGVLAFWAEGTAGSFSRLGLVLEIAALLVAAGTLASRITIVDSRLTARFFAPWRRTVALDRLASVRSRKSKASLGSAPALELADRDGGWATVRLGWWDAEPQILALLDEAAAGSAAERDALSVELLRDRPDGRSWEPGRRRRAARDRLGKGLGARKRR